jgi:hypothetical protein
MEETRSGMSWIGVLFVILVICAIFAGFGGNGFGGGWGNRQGGVPVVVAEGGYYGNGGCNRVSNCEIEKQEIIDSATTQYKIEQQGSQTRAEVAAVGKSIEDQNTRFYIQNLNEKMFDLKMENQRLQGQIYSDAKFGELTTQLSSCCCEMNRRLDGIEAEMLTRPHLSGVAVTCNGQLVPAIST